MTVFNRSRFSAIVDLMIGENKMAVHKRLICNLSGYFAKLFRERTDSESLSLNVEAFSSDLRCETLTMFVHWIYFNKFFDETEDESSPTCGELIDLYILADKWDMTILKNVVIDETIALFDDNDWVRGDEFPSGLLRKLYQHTSPGDQFRELWVDLYLWEVNDDLYEHDLRSTVLD